MIRITCPSFGDKSKPIVFLILGLLWVGIVHAQESATASGGDTIGSGVTMTYSIGQVVYITKTAVSGSIVQGVKQAYEFFTKDDCEVSLAILKLDFVKSWLVIKQRIN